MFLTPFLTIPLVWSRFKNKLVAVLVGLALAAAISFLFYVIRGIMFIYH
jgi:hypothetical protein